MSWLQDEVLILYESQIIKSENPCIILYATCFNLYICLIELARIRFQTC